MTPSSEEPLLGISDLRIKLKRKRSSREVELIRGVSLDVYRGEVVALVGESGSGKSLTARAIMRLLPRDISISGGSIRLSGTEVTSLEPRALRHVRGSKVGLVLQQAQSALNPLMTVGSQIVEAVRAHAAIDKRAARTRALALLREMGISDPDSRFHEYPFQLSGGIKQRVIMAMALTKDPELLIADEPTTALDVTVRAELLDLLNSIRERTGLAVLLITHDLGVVAGFADRVYTMYAGKIVESGPVDDVYAKPLHPYTEGLLASTPVIGEDFMSSRQPIDGTAPDLSSEHLPGCWFQPRCPYAFEQCRQVEPTLTMRTPSRSAACWRESSG